jgi:hypothetical protein
VSGGAAGQQIGGDLRVRVRRVGEVGGRATGGDGAVVEPREGAATRAVAHDDRTGRAVVPIDGAGVIRSAIVREGVGRRRRGCLALLCRGLLLATRREDGRASSMVTCPNYRLPVILDATTTGVR